MRQQLPENPLSEVLGSEEPWKAPEAGDCDAYAADVEGEGDWDVSKLTGGLDLGHRASICVDHDQPRERSAPLLTSPLSPPLLSIPFVWPSRMSLCYLIVVLLTNVLACLRLCQRPATSMSGSGSRK